MLGKALMVVFGVLLGFAATMLFIVWTDDRTWRPEEVGFSPLAVCYASEPLTLRDILRGENYEFTPFASCSNRDADCGMFYLRAGAWMLEARR